MPENFEQSRDSEEKTFGVEGVKNEERVFELKENNTEVSKPKRKTGVSKMVRFSEKDEKKAKEHFKDTFEKQSEKEIVKYERLKTEEEKKTIIDILAKMPDFIERYGGTPIDITLDHIHILDSEKLDEDIRKKLDMTKDEYGGGGYKLSSQLIYIIDSGNNLYNAQAIVHEIIHFNSFQSIELTGKGKKISSVRRIGFEIRRKDKKEVFFREVNEAITEELAKRFDIQYFEDVPVISDEVKERNSIKKQFKDKGDDIARIIKASPNELDKNKTNFTVEYYSYMKNREDLNQDIVNIYEKNKNERNKHGELIFNSAKDVFDVFAKAVMTGNLLEVARLLEKTYGKGSFRRRAERTKITKK